MITMGSFTMIIQDMVSNEPTASEIEGKYDRDESFEDESCDGVNLVDKYDQRKTSEIYNANVAFLQGRKSSTYLKRK